MKDRIVWTIGHSTHASDEFVTILRSLTAYMCAESLWWSCHRSLVSDYLKFAGWNVIHIMGIRKSMEHPYPSPARFSDGKLL